MLYIVIILLVIVHNGWYDLKFRRFLSGDYNLSTKSNSRNNKLQKVVIVFLILAFILAIPIKTTIIKPLHKFEACIK